MAVKMHAEQKGNIAWQHTPNCVTSHWEGEALHKPKEQI